MFFLTIALSLFAHAEDWRPFPANPRLPCKGKAEGKELVVLADFDGNGTPDLARLQENKKTHRVRLAVWMNGEVAPLILDEKEAIHAGNFLRLAVPGTRDLLAGAALAAAPVKASSGKGMKPEKWAAVPNKPGLKIKAASLSYGACGVNEWIFQWNEAKGKFVATAVVPIQ